ncbi:hypothetical protein [Nonomuraea sediminis]|uniref:hypothetical protein n=1 Tax=Nonomuraea sediminis TaxID=2835864 RepID=UPI001BDCA2A6|nr:hypothetical protein [Nonomuraea sediminis]
MTAVQQQVTAPGRGQRKGGRRSAGSVVLNTVLGLALAAGAVSLQTLAMSADDMDSRLTYSGAKGQEVNAGRFAVKVKGVSSAKQIRTFDKTVPTDQIFLVVDAEATVPKTPLNLAAPVLLTADGRRFAGSDKVNSTLSGVPIQPGWWTPGVFIFEVPVDALAGAKAVISPQGSALYGEPLMPEAQVDLGIDDATAKRLASAPAEVYTPGEKK